MDRAADILRNEISIREARLSNAQHEQRKWAKVIETACEEIEHLKHAIEVLEHKDGSKR